MFYSRKLAPLNRLERLTVRLEIVCSIQLSYRGILEQIAGIEPVSSAWKAEVLTIKRYLHWAVLSVTLRLQEGHNLLCFYYNKNYMVGMKRFELLTYRLSSDCSNLLSYTPLFKKKGDFVDYPSPCKN